ncbi:MAG: hemolysin family protein [Bryobacteraceae bacterium]
MTYAIPLLVIFALIALNGLFVAAEFALIGVPRAAVERRAARGERVAKLLAAILANPRLQDQYIATAQIGITFASIGLGMYGEQTIARWIEGWLLALGPAGRFAEHAVASVLAILTLTYFHIVLGEMIPKTLALQHAQRTSLWITPVMSWVRIAFYPLVISLNGLGNRILRLMGINRDAGVHQYHTPEELELVIEESEKGGLLDRRSADLMRELLKLKELTAAEIMIPRVGVNGLEVGASAAELKAILQRSSHTRYPVYQESLDSIVGFVHIKDLLPLLLRGGTLEQSQVRAVTFIPQAMPADDVVDTMRSADSQMVVVMDEHGGTAGVITEKDVLDQLMGEIHEDEEQPEVWRDAERRLNVAGTFLLSSLGEELGMELQHEEVDTVSGLILTILGRPPRTGDRVEYMGIRFEVTAVKGRGVRASRVEAPPEESGR